MCVFCEDAILKPYDLLLIPKIYIYKVYESEKPRLLSLKVYKKFVIENVLIISNCNVSREVRRLYYQLVIYYWLHFYVIKSTFIFPSIRLTIEMHWFDSFAYKNLLNFNYKIEL